jgi:hypothetical protein
MGDSSESKAYLVESDATFSFPPVHLSPESAETPFVKPHPSPIIIPTPNDFDVSDLVSPAFAASTPRSLSLTRDRHSLRKSTSFPDAASLAASGNFGSGTLSYLSYGSHERAPLPPPTEYPLSPEPLSARPSRDMSRRTQEFGSSRGDPGLYDFAEALGSAEGIARLVYSITLLALHCTVRWLPSFQSNKAPVPLEIHTFRIVFASTCGDLPDPLQFVLPFSKIWLNKRRS